MTIPAGYRAWAEVAGANPYHPHLWSPEQLTSFMAWKAQRVQMRHQARIADGTWALLSPSQRERARDDDERLATAPPPSRPWRVCPCHARPRQAAERQIPMPTTAGEALDYIHTFRCSDRLEGR